jgi:D-alanyl-D-alanine carboxypeptidase (penicillin-binding protein 5/6)
MFRRVLFILTLLAFVSAPLYAQTTSKKSASSKSKPASTPRTQSPGIAEPFPVSADGAAPAIGAPAYIVLDANSGKVLLEHNADTTRPVASTQKLLTGLIVAEDGNLEKTLRVEAIDTDAEPTKLNFKPGEVYPRYLLLQVFLIHSMNDVARALARDNAGSIDAFAERMNAKAQMLGMHNSHFVNPNGLPVPGQYSTARDMSKVGLAAYHNRILRGIVCQKNCTWTYNSGRTVTFPTTNLVLKNYALCNGMKTGYTEAAGHCLISSASFGGKDVICVVLGDNKAIWTDSYRLLNWALSS